MTRARRGNPWTPFSPALGGCTCSDGPTYYVFGGGNRTRERVGKNRKIAERALTAIKAKIDRDEYAPPVNITFRAWADEWFETALRRPNENTRRSYTSTLDYAKAAFGDKVVRKLTRADVDRFLELTANGHDGKRARSATTQAKHLRVLGSCLDKAVTRGYATQNPARLDADERPRIAKPLPSYFTDDELARLFKALPDEMPAAVFKYLCVVAVTTGMRQGELIALRWGDVRLLESEVTISRSFTPGVGLDTPKSGATRTIDLTPKARDVLAAWFTRSGSPSETELVFPRYDGDYLRAASLTRNVLYPAMKRANVDRVGEHRNKRTFHSLRHTFARITLESGKVEMAWVKQQLGHSSITITVDRYGHWSREGQKRQAAKLAEAFGQVALA